MATITVLTVDVDGRPFELELWLKCLRRYLRRFIRDVVSLFEHTRGPFRPPRLPLSLLLTLARTCSGGTGRTALPAHGGQSATLSPNLLSALTGWSNRGPTFPLRQRRPLLREWQLLVEKASVGTCESARTGGAAGGGGCSRGGQQRQQRQQETLSPQQLREWVSQRRILGGVEAASLGACEPASTGAVPTEALLTFTLDSCASCCFFRDCTIVTALTTHVPVTLAAPSSAPVIARTSALHALTSPCLRPPEVPASASSDACPAMRSLRRGVAVRRSSLLLVPFDHCSSPDPANGHLGHCPHPWAGPGALLPAGRRRLHALHHGVSLATQGRVPSCSDPLDPRCSSLAECTQETSPTLRWKRMVGASAFWVWGSLALVRDTTTGKLSSCTVRCVYLRFPTNVSGWQYYYPTTRHVLPSLDVTFDEPVCFYHLFPLFPPLYTEPPGGLTERREPASRPVSPVRTARTSGCGSRLRPPPVPGTHRMSLRLSTAPLRVPLPSPPESSLPVSSDPASDSLRAASPTVPRLLATVVTDPSFESTAASALVAELVDFAARCRLDYAASLVAESESCFAAALPHLVSTLLAPEGDLDAPDIPTPRSYAEAIEGPYSSQWQAAMDAEMASWKSTGTYVDEVPRPGANIVSGMWIFRVKRPPGSPPVFKARYVARGFSQRQGVDYFLTFSPTPKMTTLRVLLHVAAQRDYELHSLDFSTAFLQGSLHEEIWLRRPPGFTGSFPPGTQWSLRRPVYGLRQAPREWHDTLRTTLAALGFAPSTADPSLFLRTDTSLPPFYVLVYVDDLVFATADTAGLAHVKSELQERHTCTDLGELRSYLGLQITRDRAQRTITLTQSHMVQQVLQRFHFTYSSPQATPLSTRHSLSALPSDESVEPSGPYPELVGCLITSGMGLVLGGRSPVVLTGHADASWVDDQATQRSSQGYTFSLGSGSVSWRSTRSSSALSSSCEAEIYAGAMAAQELRWLTYLLTDMGEPPRSPPVLYVDNKAMLALCREHRLEHRTKHIALRYFLARELQQRGQLRLAYVASQANTADIFTKALQPCDHQCFCTMLAYFAVLCLTSLVTPCSPPLCLWGPPPSALPVPQASDARYRAAVHVEFFDRNPPPMYITLYFIVTRLPEYLRSVTDHFLSLDPTSLTVDLLEQHLLAAETSAVAVGAARGTPRPPFFEGCSPSPLAPSCASVAAVDISVPEDVGAASASAKRRSSKGKGGRGSGGGRSGGGGGSKGGGGGSSGGGGSGGTGGGSGGSGGGGGGSGGSGGGGGGGTGGGGTGARRVGSGGGQRHQQQRRSETQSPQQLREWFLRGASGGSCPYVIRTGDHAGQTCGRLHTQHRCFSRLDDAWRAEFSDDVELPHWADLLKSRIAIFDLEFDAILSAMYALSIIAEGDCYWCVLPDPRIAAAALGASESVTLHGTVPAEALHTFTLDTGASRWSSLYTLATEPPQVAASAQVSASGKVAASFSCHLLSHQTLLWNHRLDHPSLPRLRGMHSRLLVSGLPRSLPPLPPSPAPPCLPCVEGRQRAAPHSSSFPPTTAPLQTLQMDMWGPARGNGQSRKRYLLLVVDDFTQYTTVFPLRSKGQVVDVLIPWIRDVRLQLRKRFGQDLHSFMLPDSPQQNGSAERRIGLVMEVARTSMIHEAAPHFMWPFAVQYAAHQLNLWCCVSLSENSPTLRWTGEVGDASMFQVWGSRAFVRDTSVDKLSPRAIFCVFLGFVPDAPGWQFYHPTSRRVLPSKDVTFDKSVSFYSLFPYRSTPPPPPPLFLAPDPLPSPAPVQVAVGSGAAQGAASGGAASGGAELGGAGFEGAETGGAELGGVRTGGAEPKGVEPGGAASEGAGSEGAEPQGAALSGGSTPARARGAGAVGAGAARVAAGASGAGSVADIGHGGARTRGTGAAGTGGVEGAGVVGRGAVGAGAAGAGVGGIGAGGTGDVDPCAGGAGGTLRPRPYFVPVLQQVLGSPYSAGLTPPLLCPPPDQSQPPLQPASPLLAPSPYTEQSGGLTECREPVSRLVSLVCTARCAPPPIPGTHAMAMRPSSAPLRVPLPAPPKSSLHEIPDPESDRTRAVSPAVSLFLATALTDPSFQSAAASNLVAVACRLDYATALVAVSASATPPSVGGECALGTDVLEDRQEDFECLAAAVPCFASMLLAPEGDPNAPDIPTPRSYAEAITGPYSSHWQAAMDAKMASWKSTGTYVDEVPPPGANIVDGMWIFRVKRPPGSPPAFKAHYVARGFSQRQGVYYLHTFSPTPKMTTLRVLLHVAAQHDYKLHSLDFSTTFLQGSLHEEIWLRRPPGFTGTFPAGTQWSLRRLVYSLRQTPRDWHDTLRTTLAALGFAPSTTDPSLFLRTDTSLLPLYVLVYVDCVFATADTEALTLVKSELQKRHTCIHLGELRSYLGLQITRDRARRTITLTQSHMVQKVLQHFGFHFSSPQPTLLSTSHSLSAPPSDESVEPSGLYPELVGCLMYLMTCTRPDIAYPLSLLARYVAPGRHRKVHRDAAKRVLRYLCSTLGMGLVLGGRGPVVLTGHADASWADDQATQQSSQGYTFSLGSGSVSWQSPCSSSLLSSSCKAEIYAGAMAAQELRWLTYLLTDLGEQPRSPPILYVDNKAMIAMCQEHRLEQRTKHIALRYFLAGELQQRGQLRLGYVPEHLRHNKLGAKAIWTVHLGMAQNTKGWLLWDPFTKKFLVSRDCKFMENLMYKDWKAENDAKIGMRFGEVKSSSLEHVEPLELSSSSTTIRQSSLVNGGEEAKDAEEEEEEVQQVLHGSESPCSNIKAFMSLDAEEWKKAMESELKSIEENGTWELVGLPEGRKAITSNWLFKIKSGADGKIERYKSRHVARGYQQKEKVDCKELFAPVVKPMTLRTLLAGAAIKGWVVKQMDVTTAFLNGILEEEIFIAQPEGFDDGSGRVWKLKKTLYGLKQAPRQWYLKLREVLEEIGFTPSSADHSLFMLGEGEQRRFMVVYIDDILIFSPSSDLVKEVMLKLQDKFKCKALGDVSFYLGLHIERDVEKRCMRVHQWKYLEALAANFGQSEGHVATPFPSGFKCVKGPEEESVGEEERRRFHSLVGSLMYAAVNTRPDVAFAIGQLARGADGVEPGRLFLTAFSDASYASEPEDMTSVGGLICCVSGGPTSWESKKPVDQALSSVESEYMALFRAVREIVWWRRLLAELGEEQQGPTPLYCDSQGAIAFAKNPVLHGLTKHMRVKWHWTRSMVAAGEVELHYVKTTRQPADMMTKRLVEQQHWKCCKLAGMALN
ncbi:unnamed protein product [Closterium sp. NIES-53]